jgi:hypothetical protein
MKGKFGVIGKMDDWKKGDLPNNEMVYIVLNEQYALPNGNISLTGSLASDREIDEAVDQIIKDIELARKMAKHKIKKTNEKIRSSLL